ncbi:MAG: N-acetylglucosamine-6-phosphate deacetylase [Phycisphaerae bacterium]|nr:amidohydrolase family protein [Tepidisphaeraceae bacterium]
MRIQGLHYATAQPIAIDVTDGVIRSVTPLPNAPADLPYVGPGLVDLQVNGYLGEDFNAFPVAPGALRRAARALWAQGTTTFFPTVITNSVEAIEGSMRAITTECDADPVVKNAVAGVHLEGPFISFEDGARGAHAKQFVRTPDFDLLDRWQAAAGGRIRILTMSPEWPDSPVFVERCAKAGIVVSVGHTAATPEQVAAAVAAGARMITHFGNGAHLMLPRHPNYLWEQLAQDDLSACLIADGFHLPDQVIRVAMRVKGERAMIVSDAVSLAGLPAGEYATPVGGKVVLTPSGRLHLAENPKLLAGSAQMLPWGVSHLVKRGLATVGEAWAMASVRPARLVGFACGLEVGAQADLVTFRAGDAGVIIEQTIKHGDPVYARSN